MKSIKNTIAVIAVMTFASLSAQTQETETAITLDDGTIISAGTSFIVSLDGKVQYDTDGDGNFDIQVEAGPVDRSGRPTVIITKKTSTGNWEQKTVSKDPITGAAVSQTPYSPTSTPVAIDPDDAAQALDDGGIVSGLQIGADGTIIVPLNGALII